MKTQWKKVLRLAACGTSTALLCSALTVSAFAAQNVRVAASENCPQGTYGYTIVAQPGNSGGYGNGTLAFSPSDLINALQNNNPGMNGAYGSSPDTSCLPGNVQDWLNSLPSYTDASCGTQSCDTPLCTVPSCEPDACPTAPCDDNACAPSAPSNPSPEPSNPAPEPSVPSEPNPDDGTPAQPDGAAALEQQMVDLINAERAKTGAAPLSIDAKVTAAARAKSQDMIDNGYFSHTSPTYGSPFDMLTSFGISYKTAGENIAMNSTVERAHTALMNSDGHRKNILNPAYTSIGLGIVRDANGSLYITQLFIG